MNADLYTIEIQAKQIHIIQHTMSMASKPKALAAIAI